MADRLKELDFRVKRLFWEDFEKLIPFQGELVELKEKKAEKLIKSLSKYFIDPFFVWCAPDGNVYILHGHQRKKTMKAEGFIGQVPCIEIDCRNEKEAKEFILKYRSQYGELVDEKLHEFIEINNLDWGEIKIESDFADINMGTFEQSYYQDNIPNEPKDKKKHVCPQCGCEF